MFSLAGYERAHSKGTRLPCDLFRHRNGDTVPGPSGHSRSHDTPAHLARGSRCRARSAAYLHLGPAMVAGSGRPELDL